MTNDREEGRKKRKKRIITLSIALSAVERRFGCSYIRAQCKKGDGVGRNHPLITHSTRTKESYLHTLTKYPCALFINFPIFETTFFHKIFFPPLRLWNVCGGGNQLIWISILKRRGKKRGQFLLPPPCHRSTAKKKGKPGWVSQRKDDDDFPPQLQTLFPSPPPPVFPSLLSEVTSLGGGTSPRGKTKREGGQILSHSSALRGKEGYREPHKEENTQEKTIFERTNAKNYRRGSKKIDFVPPFFLEPECFCPDRKLPGILRRSQGSPPLIGSRRLCRFGAGRNGRGISIVPIFLSFSGLKREKNFDTVAVPVLEAIKCFFLDFFRKGGNRKETFSLPPPSLRPEPFPLPVLYLLRMFPPGKERKYSSRRGDDESKVRRRWPHWLFIFLHRLGSEIPFLESVPLPPSIPPPVPSVFISLPSGEGGGVENGGDN